MRALDVVCISGMAFPQRQTTTWYFTSYSSAPLHRSLQPRKAKRPKGYKRNTMESSEAAKHLDKEIPDAKRRIQWN